MLNQLFQTIFGQMEGTDIFINSKQIAYRKRTFEVEIFKIIDESEFKTISESVELEMNLNKEKTFGTIIKEVIINDKERKVLFIIAKSANQGMVFVFRIY